MHIDVDMPETNSCRSLCHTACSMNQSNCFHFRQDFGCNIGLHCNWQSPKWYICAYNQLLLSHQSIPDIGSIMSINGTRSFNLHYLMMDFNHSILKYISRSYLVFFNLSANRISGYLNHFNFFSIWDFLLDQDNWYIGALQYHSFSKLVRIWAFKNLKKASNYLNLNCMNELHVNMILLNFI